MVIDKVQKIILTAAMLICTAVISVTAITRPHKVQKETTLASLSFDEEAVKGTPEVTDKAAMYSAMDIPLSNGNCNVSICAAPKLDRDKLDVYFTNNKNNSVFVKLVIMDKDNNIIGESGIIKNGEYVKSVTLNSSSAVGQMLRAKILTYEYETYYSLGAASAELRTR